MTTTYIVQKGVPIPKIARSQATLARMYPLDKMAVGDMIFVPNRTRRSVTAYIWRISRGTAMRFTARSITMCGEPGKWKPCKPTDPGATEGVGVWRVL